MKQKTSRWELLLVVGFTLILVVGLWGTSGSGLRLGSQVLASNAYQAATGNGGGGMQPSSIIPANDEIPAVKPAAQIGTLSDVGIFGQVGIGTATPSTSPFRSLHIVGNVCLFERGQDSAGFIINRTGGTGYNRWVFGADDATGFVIKTYPWDGASGTQVQEQLVISKDDPSTPANESKVGIGTTSPTRKLDVQTASGEAVYGKNTTSNNFGSLGSGLYGVYGTSPTNGVYGFSSGGTGVAGESTFAYGVSGESTSSYGVYGTNTGSGSGAGVYGEIGSATGAGVAGKNTSSGGAGVAGKNTNATSGIGVYGEAAGNTAPALGVMGKNTSTNNSGLLGGTLYGARGQYGAAGDWGALGTGSAGVQGQDAAGSYVGLLGTPTESVSGQSAVGPLCLGKLGTATEGVFGQCPPAAPGVGPPWAGNFNGNVNITGSLTVTGPVFKGGGAFRIDHPLDPENKYLQHSFVESPDMMNVYNGNAVLDDNGEAVVELPAYFEALNRDFRYQLTAIGAPGPNLYIAQKISDNQFKIAGGSAGLEVSWQVTGIRHDDYANANRIQVEVEKPGK